MLAQVALRPVAALHLPDLVAAQGPDEARPQQQGDGQGGERRSPGAEGDVLEDVEPAPEVLEVG